MFPISQVHLAAGSVSSQVAAGPTPPPTQPTGPATNPPDNSLEQFEKSFEGGGITPPPHVSAPVLAESGASITRMRIAAALASVSGKVVPDPTLPPAPPTGPAVNPPDNSIEQFEKAFDGRGAPQDPQFSWAVRAESSITITKMRIAGALASVAGPVAANPPETPVPPAQPTGPSFNPLDPINQFENAFRSGGNTGMPQSLPWQTEAGDPSLFRP